MIHKLIFRYVKPFIQVAFKTVLFIVLILDINSEIGGHVNKEQSQLFDLFKPFD